MNKPYAHPVYYDKLNFNISIGIVFQTQTLVIYVKMFNYIVYK